MRLHPMPEFGSFALLLALALSAYTLVMGGVALWPPARRDCWGEWRGRTPG